MKHAQTFDFVHIQGVSDDETILFIYLMCALIVHVDWQRETPQQSHNRHANDRVQTLCPLLSINISADSKDALSPQARHDLTNNPKAANMPFLCRVWLRLWVFIIINHNHFY